MRATAGQNLCARVHGAGNAAVSREEGGAQLSDAILRAVCGGFLSGLFCLSILDLPTASISAWIEIIASQKRSSSSFDSLSVGSIIIVPATGNATVGA